MSLKSIRPLPLFTSSSSDPLLTQQRSKLENKHDDENENDLGEAKPGTTILV